MSGGKPTVPEIMMNTLTSSDYNSAHASIFSNINYISCAVATLERLESFQPKNYIHSGAFSPDPLGAFFNGEIISTHYSTIMKSSPLVAAHI